MQISISAQHLSVGKALHDYVESRTKEIVVKYFENAISASIHFSKENSHYTCNIIINDGINKHLIKSNSTSDEIYSSFDISIAKIEKQLRKYKDRIKSKHKAKISENAIKYIIDPYQTEENEDVSEGSPAIIAEQTIEIMTLSPSEAVMKMDLENLPALMFKNSKTNRMNVVYYRRDGNISWVDSK